MNLYQINFIHYAQKSSGTGIVTYLVAGSDEEVYEWLKTSPELRNGNYIFTTYQDNEGDEKTFDIYDDDVNLVGRESFKKNIVRSKGCMNNDHILDGLSDLYYGLTLYGWEMVKESISKEEIELLEQIEVALEKVGQEI